MTCIPYTLVRSIYMILSVYKTLLANIVLCSQRMEEAESSLFHKYSNLTSERLKDLAKIKQQVSCKFHTWNQVFFPPLKFKCSLFLPQLPNTWALSAFCLEIKHHDFGLEVLLPITALLWKATHSFHSLLIKDKAGKDFCK